MPPVENPNAAVAGGTGLFSVAVVWFVGNVWPKASVSAELGAAIAGGVSAVTLYVGREGVRGIWRTVVNGSKDGK